MQIFSSSYLWAFGGGGTYRHESFFFLKTMSRLITRVAVLHKFR